MRCLKGHCRFKNNAMGPAHKKTAPSMRNSVAIVIAVPHPIALPQVG